MRIRVINFIIGIIFLFIGSAIFSLQIIEGKKFKYQSDKNCIRLISQEGGRGEIHDREGICLAGNYLSFDLMLVPQGKNQIDKTLAVISKVLDVGSQELKARFKKGYLAPFIPVTIAKNIPKNKAIALEELRSDYNSIFIQSKPLRFYPYGKLACHIIGYLNEIDRWRLTKLKDYGYKHKDIVGFGGIEEKYDYYLRQEEGALSVEVDYRGKMSRVLGFRPPRNGKNIELTLDLRVQKIVEDCLENRKGSVIIIEPYTGAIIAMASSPGFEPIAFGNNPGEAITNIGDSALINRAISGVYPAASIFKLIVAYAALETGKINLSTSYFCSGSTRIGNRDFNCWDKHGEENLAQAIAHSCDIFFYRAGLSLGPQAIHDYAVKFGLSKSTGVDLPYEAAGLVPEPLWKRIYKFQNWFDGDTANFSIGQGYLLVTPIQIARLTAVFANKGLLVTPYIVETVEGKDISKRQKKIVPIGIKENVLAYIRQDLRKVITEPSGTANVLSDLPVSIAGKTGTAQASRKQTHGWFTGFFPFEAPKFVICVFLENNSSGYGASVLTKQIIEGMVKEKLIY